MNYLIVNKQIETNIVPKAQAIDVYELMKFSEGSESSDESELEDYKFELVSLHDEDNSLVEVLRSP